MVRRTLGVGCLLIAACSVTLAAPAPRFDALPAGWKVVEQFNVPADQAAAIAKRLGGRIQSLSNTILDAAGTQLRVNVLAAATAKDAEAIRQALVAIHQGHRECAVVRGKQVIEFSSSDLRVIKRAHYALGFRPRAVTYRVRFEAAPLEEADDMAWNRLFNAFLAWRRAGKSKEAREAIDALAARFRFGRRLTLSAQGQGGKASQYAFDPKPVKETPTTGGDARQFTFDTLPARAGVPCVSVTVTVTSEAFAFRPTSRKPGPALLGPTPFWPVEDPEVADLARTITAGRSTDAAKVEAILAWLMPGRNIRSGGPVRGSRWGVRKVLDQGFGHCWDFSDLCITLCRAAGIPARQVAGWLHEECGHIWAEVFLKGKGWHQVDPTAGTGCGSDYIPYLVTETGHMPLVYLAMPDVEVLGNRAR